MNSLFYENIFIEIFRKLKIEGNEICIFDPYMGSVKVQFLHGQCLPKIAQQLIPKNNKKKQRESTSDSDQKMLQQ